MWPVGPQHVPSPAVLGVLPRAQSTLWDPLASVPVGCASRCALQGGYGARGYSVPCPNQTHIRTLHIEQWVWYHYLVVPLNPLHLGT